ncbi:type IV secretory system conjugative DNA transfer family protein [Pseudolysinimonas sp.]|jgi:hypothetical protein|uniref:type IV secretory system conjugative DNA transfer family protein n=1 Tax=Pseudolysinimonas sp. TaxID=2680009 RepID=UPI003783A02A
MTTQYHWFALNWPRPLDPETALTMLRRLATEQNRSPFVFEAIGQAKEVRYRLAVPRAAVSTARQLFAALLPGVVLSETSSEIMPASAAVRMVARGTPLGLRASRPIEASAAVLAALSAATADEVVTLQVFVGDGRPAHLTGRSPADPRQGLLSQVLSGPRPADAEVAGRIRERATEHALMTLIRLGVEAEDVSRRHALLKGIIGALRLTQSSGTRLDFLHASTRSLGRIPQRGFIPLLPRELLSLSAWPLGDGELPGLSGLHPKPLRLGGKTTDDERVFAVTAAPGDSRRVGITARDSLFHTQIIGPTGVGKSTLLTSLITADMQAGRSVAVIDPKADLIFEGALPRVPYRRRSDVVVLDPLHEFPVGLSPLAQGNRAPELVADSIVATVRGLFPNLFGPRTSDVLSAAVLSIVGLDGATLTWLPRLLTEDGFRRQIVGQLSDPVLIGFWQEFDGMSPAQQAQFVGPVLSRLRRFLLSPTLRRTLDQPHPKFDLAELFTTPKLLFVPLNSGLLGGETTRLIGSLLVAQLWGLTLARAAVPSSQRTPVSMYIDEAAEFIRTGGEELADFLARSRSLGVALHLALQYRGQLPDDLQEALDVNARSRIVFQPGIKDAKFFAGQAPELEPEDFLALPKYHVYANLMRDSQPSGWFSARTLPAPSETSSADDLVARSMRRYGQGLPDPVPRPTDAGEEDGAIGRRRRAR